MLNRRLGRAKYAAVRFGEYVKLKAEGTVPTLQTKTDFDQMPFEIYPPMYGFVFISPMIGSPATRPFVYEETIVFPKDAESIVIVDADGHHKVDIHAGFVPAGNDSFPWVTGNLKDEAPAEPIDHWPWGSGDRSVDVIDPGFSPWPYYCVYERIGGGGKLLLAKYGRPVPMIYAKVFGPASYAACAKYIVDHQKAGVI